MKQKKRNFDKQTGSSLDFSSVLGYRSRGQEAWLGCWPAGRVDAWQARFSALMGSFPLHQNQTQDPGTALHIKRHNRTLESNQHILGSTTATFCVGRYTSFSSSGGSCSTRSSLFRLCLWLSWYRKKSVVLFFSRSRTNPRLGTRAEGTATSDTTWSELGYRSQRQALDDHKTDLLVHLLTGWTDREWTGLQLSSAAVASGSTP